MFAVSLNSDVTPSYATTIAPPVSCDINEAIRFSETSGCWYIDKDYRGQVWVNKEDKSTFEITDFGVPPSGLIAIYPPSGEVIWSELADNWVVDREAQIKTLKDYIDNNTDTIVLPKGMIWKRPSDGSMISVPLASDKVIAYDQAINGYYKGIFTLPLTLKGYDTNFFQLMTSADVQSISLSAYVETSNIITSGWMLKYGGAQFGVPSILPLSGMTDAELIAYKDPRLS